MAYTFTGGRELGSRAGPLSLAHWDAVGLGRGARGRSRCFAYMQNCDGHMNWTGIPVLVTGGASFIGSHLVDALVALGAIVTVADDLSSGRLEHIQDHVAAGRVRFVRADLSRVEAADAATKGQSCVFHLAAAHGGRGYIESHELACASNLVLDGVVFAACARQGVERIVFASSGCVYPVDLQSRADAIVRLSEDMVEAPYNPDGMYGWSKLTSERVLDCYARERGMKTVSCRYFTAYGPRATESHAVIAMIARAFVRETPFVVWGTGEQIRNWTYVSDIVEGTIRSAAIAGAGVAVNVGTTEGTRVIDAAKMVLELAHHQTEIVPRPEMPTGPYYRIADDIRLATLSGWRPTVSFADGLRMTYDWYVGSKDAAEVKRTLPQLLFER